MKRRRMRHDLASPTEIGAYQMTAEPMLILDRLQAFPGVVENGGSERGRKILDPFQGSMKKLGVPSAMG